MLWVLFFSKSNQILKSVFFVSTDSLQIILGIEVKNIRNIIDFYLMRVWLLLLVTFIDQETKIQIIVERM